MNGLDFSEKIVKIKDHVLESSFILRSKSRFNSVVSMVTGSSNNKNLSVLISAKVMKTPMNLHPFT